MKTWLRFIRTTFWRLAFLRTAFWRLAFLHLAFLQLTFFLGACDDGLSSEDNDSDTLIEEDRETEQPNNPGSVVRWNQVHAIFKTKCTDCHAGHEPDMGAGYTALASIDPDIAYQATQLDSRFPQCQNIRVGECALLRVKNGSMPPGFNCQNNGSHRACVTPLEAERIQNWVVNGMLR